MVQIEHIIEDAHTGEEIHKHIIGICDCIETAILKIFIVCDHPNSSKAYLAIPDDDRITFMADNYDDNNEILSHSYYIISKINIITKDDLRS